MHAGHRVHGRGRPGQGLVFKVHALELATAGIFFGLTKLVRRREAQIGSQFGEMPQGFAIGRTQIQQPTLARRARHKVRARVEPGTGTQPMPVHFEVPQR